MTTSIIDDVSLQDEIDEGNAILFTNQEIRKMMKLANVGHEDTFFDLGCGYGQNIKIALTEFHVKKAIGFEKNLERNRIARERMSKLREVGISQRRWDVRNEDFEEDLLKDKIPDISLLDSTVVFYGLSTSNTILNKIKKRMKKNCRLICYYGCLFPEIMPDNSDFPFFLYTFPFQKTINEKNWLKKIIQKDKSIFPTKTQPTKNELWDELKHDYDVYADPDDVEDYKERIKKIICQRKEH